MSDVFFKYKNLLKTAVYKLTEDCLYKKKLLKTAVYKLIKDSCIQTYGTQLIYNLTEHSYINLNDHSYKYHILNNALTWSRKWCELFLYITLVFLYEFTSCELYGPSINTPKC